MNEKNFSRRVALVLAYAGLVGFYGGLIGLWVLGVQALPVALIGGVMAMIGMGWLRVLWIRDLGL